MKKNKNAQDLVKIRWNKKTKKEKSLYGKMMVKAREEKKKLTWQEQSVEE